MIWKAFHVICFWETTLSGSLYRNTRPCKGIWWAPEPKHQDDVGKDYSGEKWLDQLHLCHCSDRRNTVFSSIAACSLTLQRPFRGISSCAKTQEEKGIPLASRHNIKHPSNSKNFVFFFPPFWFNFIGSSSVSFPLVHINKMSQRFIQVIQTSIQPRISS